MGDIPKPEKEVNDSGYIRPNMYNNVNPNPNPKRYGVGFENVSQFESTKSGSGKNSRGPSVPSGGYRGNKQRKPQWSAPTYDDMNAHISAFNRKIAQENQKIMRSTTERLNPLLNLVAHSNQKKQKLHLSIEAQQKIKALTKGGMRAIQGDKTKNTRIVKKKDTTKPIPGDKGVMNTSSKHPKQGVTNQREPDKGSLKTKKPVQSGGIKNVAKDAKREQNKAEADISMHGKSLNFSRGELNMLPVDAPGIRRLELGRSKGDAGFHLNQSQSPNQCLKDKLSQLRSVGFDGIVDMNSLFDETSKVFHESASVTKGELTSTDFSSLGITNSGLVQALEKKGIRTLLKKKSLHDSLRGVFTRHRFDSSTTPDCRVT